MSASNPSSRSRGSASAAFARTPMLKRLALRLRVACIADRGVEIRGFLVEVARRDAARDAVAVDIDAQRHATVHRDRERLRAAHAAEARGECDRAGEGAAKRRRAISAKHS